MTMDVARIRIGGLTWKRAKGDEVRYGFFWVNEKVVFKGWFELEKKEQKIGELKVQV